MGSGVNVVVRAPAVYGSGRVAERALCDEGSWKASLDIGSYAFQWQRDGLDIAGATGSVYTPIAGDEAHLLGCRVTASPAHQLALYSGASATIAVGAQAVGPIGPSGAGGAAGAAGATGPAAADGVAGTAGTAGAGGAAGAEGARGAAATVLPSAVLLHARLATTRGKRFTIRYLAGKGARLVLTARNRTGRTVARLASLTTRKPGRGSVGARHSLAAGSYTLVLTIADAAGVRIADLVPLIVRRA